MFKLASCLLLLIVLTTSLHVETLTKERLELIKQHQDYKHYFIFFHQPTLDALMDKLDAWKDQGTTIPYKDIKIFMNDCKRNDLPECATI
jgi:hypothetical protein